MNLECCVTYSSMINKLQGFCTLCVRWTTSNSHLTWIRVATQVVEVSRNFSRRLSSALSCLTTSAASLKKQAGNISFRHSALALSPLSNFPQLLFPKPSQLLVMKKNQAHRLRQRSKNFWCSQTSQKDVIQPQNIRFNVAQVPWVY